MQSKGILTNKKVLVTGGAGFIGSNIIDRLLCQGNKVVCLDNFSTGKRENIEHHLNDSNFTLIEGDIRDFNTCINACEDIEIVLHEAALGSVPRSIKDPITTNAVNIGGFLNMITAARDQKVKRFVYAASSSTYGDSTTLPKVEENIGKPLSPYAITKYVDELYAGIFGKLYGMSTVGLRYFNVFGQRQDAESAYAAVFPKFIKALINHQAPVIFGDGEQSRDFTYIDNVILANELAATTTNPAAENAVFNVACGHSNSLNELTHEIIRLLSAFDAEIAKIQPEYAAERLGDIRDSLASIEKAKQVLGYNPQYNVREGLEKAIDWYFNYLK